MLIFYGEGSKVRDIFCGLLLPYEWNSSCVAIRFISERLEGGEITV